MLIRGRFWLCRGLADEVLTFAGLEGVVNFVFCD